jgi:hypothetical protein
VCVCVCEREREREREYRAESVDERAELLDANFVIITKVSPHLGVLGAGIFIEERDAVHLVCLFVCLFCLYYRVREREKKRQ